MPVSIFAGCSDACGWTAGVVSSVAFGSFGVPIKAVSSKVEVDPLVMQSYKTIVCFLTCWFVVLLGEEIRWTPWGIVSGIFWVPGAACGIYAIRNAGLAIAVGTWSSIIVITSFIWGVFVFQEGVKSIAETAAAVLVLAMGLVGMSRYAKPASHAGTDGSTRTVLIDEEEGSDSSDSDSSSSPATSPRQLKRTLKLKRRDSPPMSTVAVAPSTGPSFASLEIEKLVQDDKDTGIITAKDASIKDRVVFCGGRLALTRRQLGVLGAVVNGAWGGTNMIPLHFAAKEGFGGPGYLVSYATGALIVNTALWLLIILYYLYRKNGVIRDAVECLPNWHFRELWLPGLLAGLFYSLGNFASILAVTYLGQTVGFSFCQGQIIVSGLWGIFHYEEIKGRKAIFKWFASAFLTVTGIVWLSYEHTAPGH